MTSPPPRPRFSSPEVIEGMIEALIPRIQGWLRESFAEGSEDMKESLEAARKVLRESYFEPDGYSLAKHFETAYFDVDDELVEILGDAWHARSEAHNKVIAQWVKDHGVTMPFVEGQEVLVEVDSKTVEGVIVRLLPEQARCVVRIPTLGHVVRNSTSKGGVIGLYYDIEGIQPKVAPCQPSPGA